MGLNPNGTKFLMYARTQGVRFTRTATIGRLRLNLSAAQLRNNLSAFGYGSSEGVVKDLFSRAGGFGEPLLGLLGASEVCSFDASAYEGASHAHDFNLPIDESFKRRFTAVIDGGTLEHIFNFPVAVKNCMEMLEVGGHFLAVTPTNNHSGHGFYQFSPELFFRVFGAANGFRMVRVIVFENRPGAAWFEVTDPAAIRQRVWFANSRRTNLLVLAERVAAVEIFAAPPQQSDYEVLWGADNTSTAASLQDRRAGEESLTDAARGLYERAPAPVKGLYRWLRYGPLLRFYRRRAPFSNSMYFRRLKTP